MRIDISKCLEKVLPKMHRARRQALESVVGAAVGGSTLTVTSLGRNLASNAMEKHCIKRVDRLASNTHLHAERIDCYRLIAGHILGNTKRPVVLVDWSDISQRDQLYLLRASIPLEGRSVTLYEEVHTLSTKEKPSTHQRFLTTLQELLPDECCPIVITDAGFKTSWFRAIEALGWDWIGRIRGASKVYLERWQSSRSLYRKRASSPEYLGRGLLTYQHEHPCCFVLYRGKAKGRHKHNLDGKRSRSNQSKKHQKREREPWLLATSLEPTHNLEQKVVRLYRLRMQIEESFRDLKSSQFGLGVERSNTYIPKRLEILLLIASLASLVFLMLGSVAKRLGLNRCFQANTIRSRTVLSTLFLGRQLAIDDRYQFTPRQLHHAFESIPEIAGQHCVLR